MNCSSHKPYVLGWNGLILCCFVFAPKHMKNVAGAHSFLFAPYAFRLPTILNETTTYGEYNIHACMQSEPSDVCFLFFGFFVFFFSFFLFQGEEKEERSGRLTGEGLNTYLPPSLPIWLY